MDEHKDNQGPMDINEIYERAGDRNILADAGRPSRSEDDYYGTPEGYRLFWKPLPLMLGAGIPGLALLLLAFMLPAVLETQGISLKSGVNDFTGIVRLGIAFAAFILLMLAAPLYKPVEWSPAWQRQLDSDREHFRRKQFSRRD